MVHPLRARLGIGNDTALNKWPVYEATGRSSQPKVCTPLCLLYSLLTSSVGQRLKVLIQSDLDSREEFVRNN